MVLLGGDAGLRAGEIIALEWQSVDFKRRQLIIEQMWRRVIDSPKSGRGRIVPMTDALFDALQGLRKRVPKARDVFAMAHADQPPSYRSIRRRFNRVQQEAKLAPRSVHVLRHTFCSHLAMKGAPAKAIQELAGHIHLSTTEGYMHLSPLARGNAIALLNQRAA
jgi:integrase